MAAAAAPGASPKRFRAGGCGIARLEGNTQGLSASQLRGLQKLMQRRYPEDEAFRQEHGRELALISRAIGRQVGLLIDRRGRVRMVIVGQYGGLTIPQLGRERAGAARLRGLRLLHTHLDSRSGAGRGALLDQEDLMDLLFLRLDAMIALSVDEAGAPAEWQAARLVPGGETELMPRRAFSDAAINFASEAAALESELARSADAMGAAGSAAAGEAGKAERALLISVSDRPRAITGRSLDELASLARTAGIEAVGSFIQRLARPDPRHILGKGKLAELETEALRLNAGLLLFDGELSPAQGRQLADITERRVLDRTQLILEIFARHAESRAGKCQVELARLAYELPRLAGGNRAFDRLAGGIGGRGLGETRLELDRRRIRSRMAFLKGELGRLGRQRALRRAKRAEIPQAALIGYTNAGKSSLLNRLTRSDVLSADRLFATLDPTARRLRFPREREIILTDTVGFIRDLPRELMEAFRATLDELSYADLLLHVADAKSADLCERMEAVENVLEELSLAEKPRILLLNKWDLLSEEERGALLAAHPGAIPVSGADGFGLEKLLKRLELELAAR